MKTEILIATHKPISIIESEIFKPTQVGTSLQDYTIKGSYYLDNVGDHISEKNSTFNELTAIYWAWKNLKDVDVIGLMHYRRFLDIYYKKPLFKKEIKDVLKIIKNTDKNLLKLNNTKKTEKKIVSFLQQNDVLLANPAFCSIDNNFASIEEDYKKNHLPEDWDICMSVVKKKFPEYEESIETFLQKGNKFYIGNMFIAKKKWFDNFCNWLFFILFEVEKRIKISDDPYQKRVIGFLSERLFTLYILHNNFKVKEFPILFIED